MEVELLFVALLSGIEMLETGIDDSFLCKVSNSEFTPNTVNTKSRTCCNENHSTQCLQQKLYCPCIHSIFTRLTVPNIYRLLGHRCSNQLLLKFC